MLRISIQRILSVLALLCTVTSLGLTQITVTVPSQVALGEVFQLVYRVSGAHDMGDFTAPQISTELKVLYGPQLNVLHEMRGGVSREYTTITYTLQAGQTGSYTIEGARIQLGQGYLSTPVKRIHVAKVQGVTQQPLATSETPHIADRDMYLRAVTSSQAVYLQQPVLISLYLYSRYSNITGVDRKPPEVTDFVTKEIPLQTASFTTESVSGRLMFKALIWQVLAYPQRTGELVIPAFEYDFKVNIARKVESEDEFFGNKATATVHKELHSQPVKLTVRSLPEGAPEGFDQLVGSYQMKAALSAPDPIYETGRAMTYRLDITGRGNVSLLPAPKLEVTEQFEVYEPQLICDDQECKGGNTQIHRIYEYTVIPRSAGCYTLPAVTLPYFDPATGGYRIVSTDPITINVEQGSNAVPQVGKAGQERSLQRYTPYPYDSPAPTIVWSPWSRAGWAYWLLHLLLLMGGGGAYWFIRRGQRLRADHVAYYQKHSASEAGRQLLAIRQLLKEGQEQEAMAQLYATIAQYLQWRYALSTSSMARPQLYSELQKQGVGESQIEAWLYLIDDIERARYAPQQSTDRLTHWIDQLTELIYSGDRSAIDRLSRSL